MEAHHTGVHGRDRIEAGRGDVAQALHGGHAAHRNRGQAPGSRRRCEPRCHLSLDQKHPSLRRDGHLEEACQQRSGDAVWDVARGQPALPQSEGRRFHAEGVTLHHLDIAPIALGDSRRRHTPFIDVDGDHAPGPLRQLAGQGADAGSDLEHIVIGRRVQGRGDVVEDGPVDEEVLPQPPVGHQAHPPRHRIERARIAEVDCRRQPVVAHSPGPGRPNSRRAVAVDCAATVCSSAERSAATATAVAATYPGRLGRPRCGTGARNGESVSTT